MPLSHISYFKDDGLLQLTVGPAKATEHTAEPRKGGAVGEYRYAIAMVGDSFSFCGVIVGSASRITLRLASERD